MGGFRVSGGFVEMKRCLLMLQEFLQPPVRCDSRFDFAPFVVFLKSRKVASDVYLPKVFERSCPEAQNRFRIAGALRWRRMIYYESQLGSWLVVFCERSENRGCGGG